LPKKLAHAICVGAAAGSVVGVLECLASLPGPATALTPRIWWEVAANYALMGGVLSLFVFPALSLAWPGAGLSGWSRVCVVAVLLFLPAWILIRRIVPGDPFTMGRILVYAGVIVVAFALVSALARSGWRTQRLRLWIPALAFSALVALGGRLAGEERAPLAGAASVTTGARNPPSVLLVVVDTMRADHLSLYGYGRETTPNLGEFAGNALVFDHARAESSWTKPSVATILTGLPPLVTGQLDWRSRLPDDFTTLAEYFLGAGYRTAAFSDNPVVSPVFGLDQGFETFRWHSGWWSSPFQQGTVLGRVMKRLGIPDLRTLLGANPVGRRSFRASGIVERFLDWLGEGPGDRPWFAYLHFMEPHAPYAPPGDWRKRFLDPAYPDPGSHRPLPKNHPHPWETAPPLGEAQRRFVVGLYDGEIAYWDHEFGALIEELERRELLANTLLVVTADHGEEFYEHGGWDHKSSLYDELLHVPLCLSGPGIEPGRSDAPVSLRSVLPTLLAACGIEPRDPPAFPYARSLLRPAGPRAPHEAEVEPDAGRESFALLTRGKKWILSTSEDGRILECYDLAADPGERKNIADAEDPALKRAVLEEIARRKRIELAARTSGAHVAPNEEMENELRGMGYVK
jgi:arylsulfatase A-like enzyme